MRRPLNYTLACCALALSTYHVLPSAATAQGMPLDSMSSPTMQALAAGIARNPSTSVRQFWSSLTVEGTPIVEMIGDTPRLRLVTFVFRGDTNTHGALVVTLLNDQLANEGYYGLARMYHLTGTAIWFRTYRVPSDARLTYRVGPELSPETRARLTDSAWTRKLSVLAVDPFNTRQTLGASGLESLVELPDAPKQPWIRAVNGATRGTVDSVRMHSALLGNDRLLQVYRTPGLGRHVRADNLLVVLDGDDVPATFPATVILDNLFAEKKIGSTIAIMIGNAPGARIPELWYSDAFAKAVATEFVPAIARSMLLPRCPLHCAIAGRSLGGSAALFVALRYPRQFGAAIAQSGGFHYARTIAEWSAPQPPDALADTGFPEGEWLSREFAKDPRLPLRIYLEAGAFEDVRYETRDRPRYGATTVLGATRHLRDVLTAKGYTLRYHEFSGTHRSVNWQGTFGDALLFAFPKPIRADAHH